jgi:peptide chain release factor 2
MTADELQTLISDPGFWSDQVRSSKTLQQRARLEETLALDRKILSQVDDAQALVDLAREGEPVEEELKSAVTELRAFIERVETQLLLSGENDRLNAIVNIHPGAGGTESQDWAEMLMRMYLRWAERSGTRELKFRMVKSKSSPNVHNRRGLRFGLMAWKQAFTG